MINTINYLSQLERVVENHLGYGSAKEFPIKLINRKSDLRLLDNPHLDNTGSIILPHKVDRFKDNRKNEMSLNLLINFMVLQKERYRVALGHSNIENALESFFYSNFYKILSRMNVNEEYSGKNSQELNESPVLLLDLFHILNNYATFKQLFSEYKGLENYFKSSEVPNFKILQLFNKFKPGVERFVKDFSNILYYNMELEMSNASYRAIMGECVDLVLGVQNKNLNGLAPVVEQIYDIIRQNFNIYKYKSKKKRFNLFARKALRRLVKKRREYEQSRRNKHLQDTFGFKVGRGIRNLITDNELIAIHNIQDAMAHLFLEDYGHHLEYDGENLDVEAWMDNEMAYKATNVREVSKMFIRENNSPKNIVATAILADISPSTESYNIFGPIKSSMIVYTKAIADPNFLYGMDSKVRLGIYTFHGKANCIKEFNEEVAPSTYEKIASITTGSWTRLGKGLKLAGDGIRDINANKKIITIITDGEAQDTEEAKKLFKQLKSEHIYPLLIIIGSELEKYAKNLTDTYSVIERDEIHKLGDELLKLFKIYGLCIN